MYFQLLYNLKIAECSFAIWNENTIQGAKRGEDFSKIIRCGVARGVLDQNNGLTSPVVYIGTSFIAVFIKSQEMVKIVPNHWFPNTTRSFPVKSGHTNTIFGEPLLRFLNNSRFRHQRDDVKLSWFLCRHTCRVLCRHSTGTL